MRNITATNFDHTTEASVITWMPLGLGGSCEAIQPPAIIQPLVSSALSFWTTMLVLFPDARAIIEKHATKRVCLTGIHVGPSRQLFNDPEFILRYPNISLKFVNPTGTQVNHVSLMRGKGPMRDYTITVVGEQHFSHLTEPANWIRVRLIHALDEKWLHRIVLICDGDSHKRFKKAYSSSSTGQPFVIEQAYRDQDVIHGFRLAKNHVIFANGQTFPSKDYTFPIIGIPVLLMVTPEALEQQATTGRLEVPRCLMVLSRPVRGAD